MAGTYLDTMCAGIVLHQRIALLCQRENIVVFYAASAFFAPASVTFVGVYLQIITDL